MMSIENFSKRLLELMDSEALSRRAMAKKLNLERKSILNWLEGRFYPRYDALIKLADYFKVSVDYLLGREGFIYREENDNRCPIAEVPKNFIEKLSLYMKKENLTMYKLSKKLGMGQSTLKNWFLKGSMPGTLTLLKLSDLMKESVDYLLGRD